MEPHVEPGGLDRRGFLGMAGAAVGGALAAPSAGPASAAESASGGPRTCREPAREIPVLAEYDVVVCGGGPSGCAAAVAAARHGAKTLLVEKDGYLGGGTVSQLVCVILSTNGADFHGIWHEWARKLSRVDGLRLPERSRGPIRGSVDPERVKFAWDELLSEAGAELLHHAFAATAIVEGGVAKGVFVETKAGRRAILAQRVIDTTGDGIVAAAAGVPWEQGDGEHKYAMALTKVFRLANVHKPADFPNPAAVQKLEADLTAAIERGEYDSPVITEKRRLLGYIRGWNWQLPAKRHELLSVISRVLKVDPLDPFDLTRAEREGREQARQAADFYCRYVPGCEEAYLLDTSNHIGLRSSRRLQGLQTVSFEDAWDLRKYPDGIARSSWDLDVWPADSYNRPTVPRDEPRYKERAKKLAAGDYFDIRYGCIVAQGVDNLLMAGRCLSAAHEAQSSLRIQQTSQATGQAAGTAAALSLKHHTTPRELDPQIVVEQLARDRAAVPSAFEPLPTSPTS